ncbi:MAG: hypothetical protein ABJK25_08840 [Halieaceae bacterium]
MATVYLHIGMPKTATSTLQSVLADNHERLLKNGFLYPKKPRNGDAHHLLVTDLIEKHQGRSMPDIWYGSKPRGQAWDSLLTEIHDHESDIDSVIISSELFFGQANHMQQILENVSDHLRGHEVRIVVYLRRQDQLYSSFYNQDVKGVRQWSHSAYQFYQTHQLFQQDYHQMLDSWSSVFGKKHMIIRPFEAEQWPNGDIVQDFCSILGVEALHSADRENEDTLGGVQIYLKRCLNKIGFDKGRNDAVLNILAEVCPQEPGPRYQYIHRGLYAKYRQNWLDNNRAISSDYLGDKPLFLRPIPEPGEVDIHKVNRFTVAGCAQHLIAVYSWEKYPEYRRLFAKATALMLAEQDLWHALKPSERVRLLSWCEPE